MRDHFLDSGHAVPSRLRGRFLLLILIFAGISTGLFAATVSSTAPTKIYGRTVPSQPVVADHGRGNSLDQIFVSTDLPKDIPDLGTVTDTIYVPMDSTVREVWVRIDSLTHSWMRDLRISITDPHGTEVVLFNLFPGDNVINMIHCVFDDKALTYIDNGFPPFSGEYRPKDSLSAFNRDSTLGAWVLTITDQFPEDAGTLWAWSIDVNPTVNLHGWVTDAEFGDSLSGALVQVLGTPKQDYTDEHGYYWIAGLDSGTYSVTFSRPGDSTVTVNGVTIDPNSNRLLNQQMYRLSPILYYKSSSASVPIPDQGGGSADMTLNVPAAVTIAQITTTVTIRHTSVLDLSIDLISPLGTPVHLTVIPDSATYPIDTNMIGCTFSDAADISFSQGRPPFSASYRPLDSLGALIGESAAGTWTLRATDESLQDTGKIDSFAVHITYERISAADPGHEPLPKSFTFYGNYPNPFNSATEFRFDLAKQSRVQLIVYNILGQEAARLLDGNLEPGAHTLRFDGSGLTSGIYIARLSAGGSAESHKIVLLK